MKVIFSPKAQEKLQELSDYLLKKWNFKVKNDFLEKLKAKIKQIESFPESCPKTKKIDGLYKCVITFQTTIYYRVLSQNDIIEMLSCLTRVKILLN